MTVIHESKAACPSTQTLRVSPDLNLAVRRGDGITRDIVYNQSQEIQKVSKKKGKVTELNIKCT